MKSNIFLIFPVVLTSCGGEQQKNNLQPKGVKEVVESPHTKLNPIDTLYPFYNKQGQPSVSKGTVSNGSLENGRIVPFSGKNFQYFNEGSYVAKRAFVNDKVLSTMLAAYKSLEATCPGHRFGIMECSNEHGGRIKPHRTHQNGLSVDFMTPLLKNGKTTADLSDMGPSHYLMEFDANGKYEADPAYSIDFNTMALHLLALQEKAKQFGLKIDKVILKIELKDNLFAIENGKKLKASGIYFATNLSPLINSLHDDHYHVDFKVL